MVHYCNKCKVVHKEDEMCPQYAKQLQEHPELLGEAAKFTSIAGQYYLISSQTLETAEKEVNKAIGTNLSYEGTHRFARDIQIFKRLNDEPFKQCGVFSTPEIAKSYLETVQDTAEKMKEFGIVDGRKDLNQIFDKKLTGYSQEVDFVRFKNAKLSTLFEKSSLLDGNVPGVDATTINRVTGKTISRTTIKASINPITKDGTAIAGVKEALESGTVTKDDIIFSVKGTSQAAKNAGLSNKVIEKNTNEQVISSNKNLREKILAGEATTSVTLEQATKKMAQGAVIGAVIGLTISSITNYIAFKNGEISEEEVFKEIGEDTLKSAITGGALAGITLFLPGGVLGFVAGMAIGIYVGTVCTNVLDEILCKGACGAILDASGFVYGMSVNLESCIEKINKDQTHIESNARDEKETASKTEKNFDEFDQLMKG